MNKKYTVIILLLSVFALTYGCKSGKRKTSFNVEKQTVEVVKIQKNNIQERVFLTGDLKGIEEVKLYSFVTGILKQKFVKEGQPVFKGQPLFSIDQTSRTVDMLDHIVRSPISGVASDIQLDAGDQVVANQTVIGRVVQSSFLKVKSSTSVKNVGKLKIGQKALIKIDAFPNEVITGTVHKISPVVDLESRTVKIEVIIDNRNLKLKSGMFANVEILTDINKDKILIPQESVLFDDNQNYVYKLDKTLKKAIRQIVTIGRNYSGNILIKDGLKSGDFVITKGQYSVFHNFPIRVVKTAENISLNQN